MALDSSQKKALVEEYRRDEKDTGSPEVQVALINTRIRELTDHLRTHEKDHHSRYGMFKLVGQQRRLLRYLYKKDVARYRNFIAKIGIRDTIGRR